MKKLMFLILATSLILSAAFVPVDRARKVAENQYMQYCADASTKSANVVKVVENKYEGEATWYAFEFDKGFVIVSADDAVKPILGYSDHGFVSDLNRDGGQNFKEWFGNYDRQIAKARKTGYVDTKAQETWKNIENNVFSSSKAAVGVDRLVKSAWDQVWPWNDDCPEKDATFTYVGCVATAMAQITRYHRWPDVGVGSASYSWNGQTLSANFTTHTWNYDLMPEVNAYEYGLYPTYWESGITQAEVDELALQSYWMGLSVNMQYGTTADGGSGAYSTDVDNAFLDHWKASSSTYSNFTTPAVGAADPSYNTIKAQLDAGRPWYWSGGVHAFVLDGYRNDYWYHFNWGWAGSYDGWFERGYLVPDGTGSGGGDGDYSSGQSGVTYVPSTNPFTAWPATTVSGSVANGEDITVNWNTMSGATEYELYRTVNKQGIPTLVTTTTSTSYQDIDKPAGDYAYHVVTVYATGHSHNSNVYSATIATVGDYKYATALSASRVGRTSIDLSWVKPYTGVTWMETGWEDGTFGTWDASRASYAFSSSSNNKSWVTEAADNNWFVGDETTGFGAQYIHDGSYSAQIGYTFSDNTVPLRWLYSPSFTVGAGGTWDFWTYYINYTTGSGLWPTDIYYVFYTGTFNERTGVQIAGNTTILEFWDGEVLVANDPVNYGNNWYDSMVSIDLSSIAGQTGRLAFVYSYNDGYQMALDDVVIGAPTGGIPEPTGYEVYREGSKIADVSGPTNVTYSDTGFADGYNSYYVKTVYPTGVSIPSNSATAYMDANPQPYYLSGIGGSSAQLSWYQPYKNPPMWYCYYDVNKSTTTIDMMDVPAPKRRVKFATDAGYYYPATIDSISAIFYDWDEGNWGGANTFNIRIQATGGYAPGGGMLPDTTLFEALNLTATHLQEYKVAVNPPITRTSRGWAVEVEALSATTGNPGNLAGLSPDGEVHSYFYYSTEDSYNYYMVTGGVPAEYAIMSHITSADPPPIAKTGWVTASDMARTTEVVGSIGNDEKVDGIAMENPRKETISGAPVYNAPKAMDYYRIYRDGVSIGTSTTLNYEDTSASGGDHTYKVTAVYSSPAGESDYSNEVVLNITGGSLQAPTNVVTSIVSGEVKIDWDDMSAPEYAVYSSADPYGTFTLLTTVTSNTYTYTGTEAKMFFYIASSDGAKKVPAAIEVKKSMTR